MRAGPWRPAEVRPVDLVLALGCLVVSQQEVWFPAARFGHRAGPRPVEALAYAVVSVALLWRRSNPLAVAAVVAGALAAFELLYRSPDGLGPLLPLAVALYAAGRFGSPRQFAAAAVLVVAGMVVHEVRDPGFVLDGQAVMAWALVAVAGTVGQSLALADARLRAARLDAASVRQESATARERAVAAERSRIARDLHDLVGHGLSLIVLQLTALATERGGGETHAERQRLGTLDSVARTTLAEMRRLVSTSDAGRPDPPLGPQPRLTDLPALVDHVRRCGFTVDLEVDEGLDALPAGVEVTLFRVAQEAMTNVVRHARAGSAVIAALRRGHDAVTLRVVSERAPGEQAPGEGRGIAGMRERVALYGGRVLAAPDGPGRFVVEACVPLAAEGSVR